MSAIIDFVLGQIYDHPYHIVIELCFVLFIIFLLPQKSYKLKNKTPDQSRLTEKEIDEMCEEWNPEPLVPVIKEKPKSKIGGTSGGSNNNNNSISTKNNDIDNVGIVADVEEEDGDDIPILSSACGPTVIMNGREGVINMATFNFLGFATDPEIQKSCEKVILKYGVGACGPRGFYGTIDVHMELENRIAKFWGSQESILYSYGFQTIASAIPALSKINDVIVCDEGVNFPIQIGCQLSRSTIRYFRHNDMQDLERVLRDVVETNKKSKKQRRFIAIEGVYQNYGDIAPLREIIQLKKKYCFRLIMDDSFGVGVLGEHGRGIIEHFGVDLADVDVLTAALGNAFASEGGFCVGETQIVDHQRLSGVGYCFSASLPPFLAQASIEVINRLEKRAPQLEQLRKNIKLFESLILDGETSTSSSTTTTTIDPRIRIDHQSPSPIFHLRLKNPHSDRIVNDHILQQITTRALDEGLGLVRSKYARHEKFPPESSIRMTVMATHTEEQIRKAAQILKKVVPEVLDSPIEK